MENCFIKDTNILNDINFIIEYINNISVNWYKKFSKNVTIDNYITLFKILKQEVKIRSFYLDRVKNLIIRLLNLEQNDIKTLFELLNQSNFLTFNFEYKISESTKVNKLNKLLLLIQLFLIVNPISGIENEELLNSCIKRFNSFSNIPFLGDIHLSNNIILYEDIEKIKSYENEKMIFLTEINKQNEIINNLKYEFENSTKNTKSNNDILTREIQSIKQRLFNKENELIDKNKEIKNLKNKKSEIVIDNKEIKNLKNLKNLKNKESETTTIENETIIKNGEKQKEYGFINSNKEKILNYELNEDDDDDDDDDDDVFIDNKRLLLFRNNINNNLQTPKNYSKIIKSNKDFRNVAQLKTDVQLSDDIQDNLDNFKKMINDDKKKIIDILLSRIKEIDRNTIAFLRFLKQVTSKIGYGLREWNLYFFNYYFDSFLYTEGVMEEDVVMGDIELGGEEEEEEGEEGELELKMGKYLYDYKTYLGDFINIVGELKKTKKYLDKINIQSTMDYKKLISSDENETEGLISLSTHKKIEKLRNKYDIIKTRTVERPPVKSDTPVNLKFSLGRNEITEVSEILSLCFTKDGINSIEHTFVLYMRKVNGINNFNSPINFNQFLIGPSNNEHMFNLQELLNSTWHGKKLLSKKLKSKNYLPTNVSDRIVNSEKNYVARLKKSSDTINPFSSYFFTSYSEKRRIAILQINKRARLLTKMKFKKIKTSSKEDVKKRNNILKNLSANNNFVTKKRMPSNFRY